MKMGEESSTMSNNQAGQPQLESTAYLDRSIATKIQWTQRALSPWVARWLQRRTDPEAHGEKHFQRYSQVPLTFTGSKHILDHVQRAVARSTVWRPDVGSLEPGMVDRFSNTIVERFPDIGAKYAPLRREAGLADGPDLTLAGRGREVDMEAEQWTPMPEEPIESPTRSGSPSMAEVRARLEIKPGMAPMQAPRRIQRAVAPAGSDQMQEASAPLLSEGSGAGETPSPQWEEGRGEEHHESPARPSVADMRAMWEAKKGHPAKPTIANQPPSRVQRAEAAPPSPPPSVAHTGRRVARRFSRIEEMTSSGNAPADVGATQLQPARQDEPGHETTTLARQAEIGAPSFHPQPEASVTPQPPGSPGVQRQVAPEGPLASAAVEPDVETSQADVSSEVETPLPPAQGQAPLPLLQPDAASEVPQAPPTTKRQAEPPLIQEPPTNVESADFQATQQAACPPVVAEPSSAPPARQRQAEAPDMPQAPASPDVQRHVGSESSQTTAGTGMESEVPPAEIPAGAEAPLPPVEVQAPVTPQAPDSSGVQRQVGSEGPHVLPRARPEVAASRTEAPSAAKAPLPPAQGQTPPPLVQREVDPSAAPQPPGSPGVQRQVASEGPPALPGIEPDVEALQADASSDIEVLPSLAEGQAPPPILQPDAASEVPQAPPTVRRQAEPPSTEELPANTESAEIHATQPPARPPVVAEPSSAPPAMRRQAEAPITSQPPASPGVQRQVGSKSPPTSEAQARTPLVQPVVTSEVPHVSADIRRQAEAPLDQETVKPSAASPLVEQHTGPVPAPETHPGTTTPTPAEIQALHRPASQRVTSEPSPASTITSQSPDMPTAQPDAASQSTPTAPGSEAPLPSLQAQTAQQPLVQRKAGPEIEPPPTPDAPNRPTAGVQAAQRAAVGREMAPGPAPAPSESAPRRQRSAEAAQPASSLEEAILMRAQSSANLPLIEPPGPAMRLEPEGKHFERAEKLALPEPTLPTMTRTQVLPRMTPLIQANFEDQGAPAADQAWRVDLPLPPGSLWEAPVSRPASPGLLQRSPDLNGAAQHTSIVQRAMGTESETSETQPGPEAQSEPEAAALDLDELARQIYPLIKRMLAVERERRSGR
jgi:hypothetical protein